MKFNFECYLFDMFILVWHGIIFVRAGPYRDGIFRFIIILQDE